ncbi:MAG: 23S rRNA (uracil(1939)-C(5))-methyltransferase RlmD [Defluviitaleaceae bacterium]|nr:23S rRNA (uracil(1939)-C(5))-methyltransferase RlmD [Defluviitaleaceae bacterium]
MINKDMQIELTITSVGAEGAGIGHYEGFVVFVKTALPGDEVLVKILKVKNNYAEGEVVEILKPSENRVEAICDVADVCGGCTWQHFSYEAQLIHKRQIVYNALQRIGKIDNPPVFDVVGMESPFNYRGKGTFFGGAGAKGLELGMYKSKSKELVKVSNCHLQPKKHVEIMSIIESHITSPSIAALMESVTIRHSFAFEDIMVIIAIDARKMPNEAVLLEKLALAGVTTVLLKSKSELKILAGEGYIREKIGHITYKLSASSFFQVNPAQAKVLYDIALEQAGLDGSQTVLDAHVGVGGIALYAAKHAKKVVGVDIVESAIEDAKANAELNGLDAKTRFIRNQAETAIPNLINEGLRPDVVFLDPPRKGCGDALIKSLADNKAVKKIVYISCDPATLARDVEKLVAGGFALKEARPVDMFPMTSKIEVSCLLERWND